MEIPNAVVFHRNYCGKKHCKGEVIGFNDITICVLFDGDMSPHYFHFAAAFLGTNPLFTTKDARLRQFIENQRHRFFCKYCKRRDGTIVYYKRTMLCPSCKTDFGKCELCGRYTIGIEPNFSENCNSFYDTCPSCRRKGIIDLLRPYVPPKPLYIHKGRVRCLSQHHLIVNMTALFDTYGTTKKKAKLNIQYCINCGIHFMSYSALQLYLKEYQLILGNFIMPASFGEENGDLDLALASSLRLAGYYVSKNSPFSDAMRQEFLENLIISQQIRKEEALSHLEYLINHNGKAKQNRYPLARWKADYRLVLSINIDRQPTVENLQPTPWKTVRHN